MGKESLQEKFSNFRESRLNLLEVRLALSTTPTIRHVESKDLDQKEIPSPGPNSPLDRYLCTGKHQVAFPIFGPFGLLRETYFLDSQDPQIIVSNKHRYKFYISGYHDKIKQQKDN